AQRKRDAAYGAQVLGDVLAAAPVSPCGSLHEGAVLVHHRHGQTVHLGLADEGDVIPLGLVYQAAIPRPKLLLAEGVGQAQHGLTMLDNAQGFDRRRSDSLSRRVWRDQLRMAAFEVAQLADE